ncbi:MAG: CYTH domain-containing protein [Lachnospiraceae bacterium]|jgi:CYTH domain-containing protein|nr:CYTH domain-containing protein [Lachnospiraceae bacterium]
MEIERKWMVKGWPEESASLPLVREQLMRQGYVTVYPTVRIREEAEKGGSTEYILCFKSPPSRGGLSRKEIEFPITPEQFAQLEDLIGFPLIPKLRRSYRLADGLVLEVNLVDQGMETEFMYAEIEYETEEQARSWDPADSALSEYLNDEVTGQPRQTMGAYWQTTRVRAGAK